MAFEAVDVGLELVQLCLHVVPLCLLGDRVGFLFLLFSLSLFSSWVVFVGLASCLLPRGFVAFLLRRSIINKKAVEECERLIFCLETVQK